MLSSSSGPLNIQTLVSLLSDPYNFDEKAFRFNLTAFGGDRYICLRAPPPAQDADPQVGIVDMFDDFSVERRTSRKADGAMKHPSEEIMVLRGYNEGSSGQFIQVFDLTTKQRLGEHAFTQDICLWRFIDDRILVLVSGDEVYHWDIRGDGGVTETSPKIMMKREGRMASRDIQVINYCVDDPASPQWALLAGIYLAENRAVRGCLQLFCVEKQMSQFLSGYAGCFGTLRTNTEGDLTRFFSFVEKKPDSPMKLYVMDIYAPRGEGHPTPFKKVMEFQYPQEFSQDFPISAHFSKRHGVIFLVSKNGHCMIFDALTATHLYTERVSKDGIFLSQQDTLSGGVKSINRKGLVMRIFVDEDNLIEYVARTDKAVAKSLSDRYCYRQSKEVCRQSFDQLFLNRNYKLAAMLCALSKGDGADNNSMTHTGERGADTSPYPASTWLRNEQVFNMFRNETNNSSMTDFTSQPGGGFGDSNGGDSASSGGSALHQYFTAVLSIPGGLTRQESLELVRALCSRNKVTTLRELIYGGRLECSEAIGDLVNTCDKKLASAIYTKAKCIAKIIGTFIEQNDMNKLYRIVTKVASISGGILPFDIQNLFRQVSQSASCVNQSTKPDYLEMLIKFALVETSPRLINPLQLFTTFAQSQQLAYITAVFTNLIPELKTQLSDQELMLLETRILEANISTDPANAGLLFQQSCFLNFDKTTIGRLTERNGLYKRALECFEEFEDIRRVIITAASHGAIGEANNSPTSQGISQQWFNSYLEKLPKDNVVQILKDLLLANCENIVIQYARLFYDQLGVDKLLELFEGSIEGTYYFTGSILNSCDNPEVHFKYIQTAAMMNNWQECERVIRESKAYDPIKVKEFLKTLISGKTSGSRASGAMIGGSTATTCESAIRCLTHLADMHDDVADLTEFLFREDALEFIELYVTRVNPAKCAVVINILLNLGISDEKILEILHAVRGSCDIEAVVEVMESRDKLSVILPWMEERLKESGWSMGQSSRTSRALNNAIAKVYVDRRDVNTKSFLQSNADYDPLVIGKYCENKDPHLAVLAYTRGKCDKELVDLTNSHGLYRLQASYVLQRESESLWDYVLDQKEEEHVKGVLDQLVASALIEVKTTSAIYCVVTALTNHLRRAELLDLLERIIIHKTVPSPLGNELINSSRLQNLLLLTAMQVDQTRANELIHKLDKFDVEDAAIAALSQPHMENVALSIYEKHNMHIKAIEVMLNKQNDLAGAEAYAKKVDNQQVYMVLANYCLKKAQTSKDEAADRIVDAMRFYRNLDRCPDVAEIIRIARETSQEVPLIEFLKHFRSSAHVSNSAALNIDTELAYTMAKLKQISELEKLLGGVNTANCQKLGDSLFDDAEKQRQSADDTLDFDDRTQNDSKRLYELAKLFYSKIPNYTRLTTCLIRLYDYKGAFEMAKRANTSKSWLEVAQASISAGDWSIAESSANHVVEHGGDNLEKIVQAYENHCRFEDLIRILENGCKGSSNIQLLTELGVAYARHQPQKTFEFLKRQNSTGGGDLCLNVPKLTRICEKELLWKCVMILYKASQEYDQALTTILTHPESCWDHTEVCELMPRITNSDLIYKTITHYIDEHPSSLNDLLIRCSDMTSGGSGSGSARTTTTPSPSCQLNYLKLVQTLKSHPLHLAAGNDLSQSPVSLIIPYLELEQSRSDRLSRGSGGGAGAAASNSAAASLNSNKCSVSIINNLLNDIYLDFKDVDKLKHSIINYREFNHNELAERLENDDLLALKQLALQLYKEEKQYDHAIEIAKKFKQYPEAIAIALQSKRSDVAESLLTYFVQYPSYFSACLQVCASLIRPEIAVELAWSHNITAEIMPFIIHTIKTMNSRLHDLETKVEAITQGGVLGNQSLKNSLSNPTIQALPNAPAFTLNPPKNSYIQL